MKTSISHIPQENQLELLKVVDLIRWESKNKLKVEMIILFWSYARGEQVVKDVVMEWNNKLEYRSDFDILVVTRKPSQERNLTLSYEISKKINQSKEINTPVSILIEDIYHINDRLGENRYFYLDIKKEWIILYDSWKCILWEARILSEQEKIDLQKDDFNMWFFWWKNFFKYSIDAMEKWNLNDSAFLLHQSAERYISAFLLVSNWYKSKTHDLQVLYNNMIKLDKEFETWFDLENENKYFVLLKKAYVDARYSKSYQINKQEIKYLHKKVEVLERLVEQKCLKIIN